MTPPRCILRGATYLVTRRCSERRFFLRPSASTNALVEFAIGYSAQRYRIQLHAFAVLSNHYHLVATDPDGRICDFVRDLNSLIARSLNAEMGRWEHFWDSGRSSLVRLVEAEDIAEKIVYTLANPVSSGLVDSGRKWPGLRRGPRDLLRPDRRARRDGKLFGDRTRCPREAEIELSKPPGFENLSTKEFVEWIEGRVSDRESELRDKAKQRGRGFLGRKAVLAQDPLEGPLSGEPRRKIDPKIACRNSSKRIQALRDLRAFVEAYRAALGEFQSGIRDVVFPRGTWWMRVHLGAACEVCVV